MLFPIVLQRFMHGFRDLTLPEEKLASEEKFINTILQWLEDPLPLSENHEADISLFYKLGVTVKSENLPEKRENSLRQYATKENIRKEIGRALEAATFLQAPLYVGKASNRLAERVWEHVSRRSDFMGTIGTSWFISSRLSLSLCANIKFR